MIPIIPKTIQTIRMIIEIRFKTNSVTIGFKFGFKFSFNIKINSIFEYFQWISGQKFVESIVHLLKAGPPLRPPALAVLMALAVVSDRQKWSKYCNPKCFEDSIHWIRLYRFWTIDSLRYRDKPSLRCQLYCHSFWLIDLSSNLITNLIKFYLSSDLNTIFLVKR